ncbi:RNA polymerase sigma-70 factor [Danxiaibacter flavus]|uniref:RNA polymerase sigma-70 factor n=1 Tax=Danxiaibacter flavus TaxID=3049108 RepID=A0ABV3ZII6_9BACT|nr:RNA polymerase sigma-70 factor [Chitinophagaceae bacterium DXS]
MLTNRDSTNQTFVHTIDEKTSQHFEALYEKHADSLFALAFKTTKSSDLSQDIVQEVFLTLWSHRTELHTIKNIDAWLYTVTENKLIDFLRKTAADNRLREILWKRSQSTLNETEEFINAKECRRSIQQAIKSLPPQRQLIYRLNRDAGMNYKEIADALSISRHTVKNQLSSALQAIQRFISGSIGLMFILLSVL